MQLSYGSTKTGVRIQESGVRRKPKAESKRQKQKAEGRDHLFVLIRVN